MNQKPLNANTQYWPVDSLIFYARNPRKNDGAVDRMCASIREYGFKIPVLARSDRTIVDGHLRVKAARKLGLPEIPVILCDEWSETQESLPPHGQSIRHLGGVGRGVVSFGSPGSAGRGFRSELDRV